MTPTLALAQQLIAQPSLTPEDALCQSIVAGRLAALGFMSETMPCGPAHARVSNLWSKRPGSTANQAQRATELIVFAGHTDVVPTGGVEHWRSDPFTPTLRDGHLFGRGAADMKTSIAAFVVAIEEFLLATPEPMLSIALLLTSDEEGPALDGTVRVCEALQARGERVDHCIVGEPTSLQHSGDMIKNGRRGSLSARLTIRGKQGHVAYPDLASNPIHLAAPVLAEWAATQWDAGNEFFPPTTWQVSNIHAGTGAGNVIPGVVIIDFNFRFGTASTAQRLQHRVQEALQRQGLDFELVWTLGAEPFLTAPGALLQVAREAIKSETGIDAALSTTGGTSDGRFIARICPQVIELGPPNASIHQIDEHIALAEIEPLKNIYRRILELLNARLCR